jgi:hypothetical protein
MNQRSDEAQKLESDVDHRGSYFLVKLAKKISKKTKQQEIARSRNNRESIINGEKKNRYDCYRKQPAGKKIHIGTYN